MSTSIKPHGWANKTNYAIAQEQNAINKQMHDEQIKFEWDMFNAENRYNSPSEQMKRYKEAGLNPAYMYNSIDSGTGSGGSAPSWSGAAGAKMEPVNIDGSVNAIQQSLGSFYSPQAQQQSAQRDLLQQEANQVHIENQYLSQKLLEEIYGKRLDNEDKDMNNYMKQNTMNEQMQQQRAAASDAAKQLILRDQQIALGLKELNAFDQRNQVTIANTIADTMYKSNLAGLTQQETEAAIKKNIILNLDATKAQYEMKAINQLTDKYFASVKSNLESQIKDAGASNAWEFINKFHSDGNGNLTATGKSILWVASILGLAGGAVWGTLGSMNGSSSSSNISSTNTYDGDGNLVRRVEHTGSGKSNSTVKSKSRKIGKK